MFFLGSCVESSQKYKSLQARLDSLSTVHIMQNSEMESMLADLNDISAGMQSLRDAERLLTLETINENKDNSKSKQQLNQLKKDVQAITEAIASYKEQISKLEGKNKSQSAEFKRLIAGLNAELDQRTQKLNEITKQLAEKNQQLAVKTEEVANLTENVEALDKANKSQQMTINEQDMAIHQGHYLIGNRKELKELIESHGGKVTGSVTSKTNYLINNDAMSNSTKNKKARELGIPILTEQAFIEQYHLS